MMKIIDKYIDVLTEGEWWDYIPDDFSDWERWLLERERAMKEMVGIASRLTFCGECVYFNRITDTLGTCERCAEGTKTEDDFCSNGDAGGGRIMSVNWHEDNRKPQEAGSYYTIIEDVVTHDVEVGITTYDESKQQWLIDEQCGRQVKAWAKIEKPCMPENPYVPEEFRKRLMTYMGRTVGEKSLSTLKSEEQKEKELKEKIEAHSKWLRNAGGERLNLDGVDLQGMDLSGVIFCKASLNGTNFSGTTLRETNFREAELKGANFSGAYLKRANFADANVRDTVFENAEIACVDFTGAKLNFADLKNANCEHANFAGANLSNARFVNANCRHAYFGDAKGCANFKDADLAGVILTSAMEKFYGGWITDTQTITALELIIANGLHSPHVTKKIKRKLRSLDKFISNYRKENEK